MSRRRAIIGSIAGVVSVGLVVGVTVLWPGLDARDTPPVDTGVWALQTSEGRRYARVNTAIDELDTVRNVANPTSIVQNKDGAFLFTDSYARVARINAAAPINLDEETMRTAEATPAGTSEAVSAGHYVAYRTESGAVYGGVLKDNSLAQIDPQADIEDAPDYQAQAIALTEDGVIYSYSATDDAILRYSIPEGKIVGTDPVAGVGDEPALTAVGSTWFLFDSSNDTLWTKGVEDSRKIETAGTVVLGRSAAQGTDAYLADEGGLIRLPVDGTAPERIVGGNTASAGFPARPTSFNGVVYAAWLNTDSGTLWRSGKGEQPLDFAGKTLDDSRRASFVASGSTMILNETRSGWVWTMPDGKLVPSSQDWVLDDEIQKADDPSQEQAQVVLDPKPPVAEADAFGVRPGALTALPVMLNDHDPNEDVLSIDPSSVTGLDPTFGTLGITDGGGRIAVSVSPTATGSASFTYRLTDGTTADGLYSAPTTVTLTTVEEDVNRPPQWCGTNGCLAKWQEPELKPGGAVTVPVLDGWTDPDGDPLLLLDVKVPEGSGAAAVTQQGEVVYQHGDPSATAAAAIPLEVTVSDTRGLTATKVLKVTVTPTPVLKASSFSQLTAFGPDLTVDVSGHVTGTAGDLTLKSVQLVDDADAEATISASGTGFDFTAKQPGVYRVQYTVSDGTSEADATARITLLPPDASAQLATAPVVAFLRPQEDSTIDVLAAVSNPTRRVLLASDVMATADDGASLQVDSVGQNFIRVTGTTVTGDPGRLGVIDYTVSDGTTDSGASIKGQATVYLLPPTLDLAPIAVDDSLVVRGGAQIDIPALANDVAPSGAALVLDPSSVKSSDDSGLAFAAGSSIRYLAPKKPGSYTIDYAVYSAGSPALTDRATVKVTVIGDESNRAPRPKQLEGRVLSGQSTRIAFDSYGVDPDGDDVVLDRIVDQPKLGTAAISADGDAIVYTSSPGAPGGQDTFTYRVTDPSGESRVGTARVGVLNEQSNPSPITFTDYVQVTVGDKSIVRVTPLKNDIDPTNGKLKLTNITPNLTEKLGNGAPNPEFAKWKTLIAEQSDTEVTISAGGQATTLSFLYDVESSSGNTGRGLIVVKVVREIVPDYPVVSDTVLTPETRSQFADGVDVLKGRVSWSGGDIATLKVGTWSGAKDLDVSGNTISGALTPKAKIVPFAIAGKLSDGTDITTYAFVRIPAEDDKSVSLRAGIVPQQVKEKESVTFNMASLVVMPPETTLEVSKDITNSRGQATCALADGTNIVYNAGEGAPWNDTCAIPVRVTGTEDWTYLSVPIVIQALDPVPVLRPASITVTPGGDATFDLAGMLSWQGREDPAGVTYAIQAPNDDVEVSQSGQTVSVHASDTAIPGRERDVTVSITSHPNVAPSSLIIRIGPAPSTMPRGGSVVKQCTQAQGTTCSFRVVGAEGEVNPLPDTPLVLASVATASVCSGVRFDRVDDTTVSASWDATTPGGACTAAFVLTDAQGRASNGERQGTINFDLLGFPRSPTAISQTAFGDGTVQLSVNPAQGQSYPAISGYVVTSNGASVGTCSADGSCPSMSAPNGEKREYSAVAVNSVGNSAAAVKTVAWAYAKPGTPAGITAVPLVSPETNGNKVRLTITGIDTAGTGTIQVSAPNASPQTVPVGASQKSITLDYMVNTNAGVTVTATPVSRFEAPPKISGDGTKNGGSVTTQANGIGKPTNLDFVADIQKLNFAKSTLTVSASAVPGGTGAEVVLRIAPPDGNCEGVPPRDQRTFKELDNNREYTITICADSKYDGKLFGRETFTRSVRMPTGTEPPEGFTYLINAAPNVTGSAEGKAEWLLTPAFDGVVPSGYSAEYNSSSSTRFDTDPGLQVRLRSNYFGSYTEWGAVTASSESPSQFQTRVNWTISCVRPKGDDPGSFSVESSSSGAAQANFVWPDDPTVQYLDWTGDDMGSGPASGPFPAGMWSIVHPGFSVNWDGTGLGLSGFDQGPMTVKCAKNN